MVSLLEPPPPPNPNRCSMLGHRSPACLTGGTAHTNAQCLWTWRAVISLKDSVAPESTRMLASVPSMLPLTQVCCCSLVSGVSVLVVGEVPVAVSSSRIPELRHCHYHTLRWKVASVSMSKRKKYNQTHVITSSFFKKLLLLSPFCINSSFLGRFEIMS